MKYRINKMPGNGDTRYYIACSVRNKNRVSTKNIKSLGRHSVLSKLHPDLDAYLKEQLDLFNNENEDVITLKLNPNKPISFSSNGTLYGGNIFIKRILDSMHMNDLFDSIQAKYRFTYSLSDLMYFLISTRILFPDSKYGMYKNSLNKQLKPIDISKDDIFRAMDVILENKDEILKHCYDNEPIGIKRDKRILYYDCTNTYFESEFEDDLRARGHGKRNEVEPLVSLGLMMDASGIPLTYTVFKGSTNEQKTLIPLENEIINDFRQSKFVIITDAGLSSRENRCFNGFCDRKYITTLPVRKMSEEKLKKYIFDEKKEWITTIPSYNSPHKIIERYQQLSEEISNCIINNKDYSSLSKEMDELSNLTIYRRYPVLADKKPKKYKTNNNDEYIDEDYLISFSLKYLIRQRIQRNKIVEKAKKLIKKDGSIKAKNSSDPKFYLTELKTNTNTGETSQVIRQINDELILEQEKLDGYYCVSTNLSLDDNETIITAMKYRWFIEDSFRILKHEFGFRPVGHSKQDRIKCHFFTCFLSLLTYRYLQKLSHDSNNTLLKKISDECLLSTLRNYNLTRIKNDFLVPSFTYNETIKTLEELFNVNLSNEIITPSKLEKELKKQILKK